MHLSVFLVDDQPDVRLLWRLLIEQANNGLEVVGEAGTGSEALERDPGADVYVVDFMMPGMTGIELTAHLRERGAVGPVVLCSAFLDDEVTRKAAEAGVTTCLSKDDMGTLPETIRAVAA